MLPLQIFEVRYLDLIKRCHQQQLPFGIAWIQQGSEVQVPGEVPALHSLGCLAHIRELEQVQPNFFRIVCQGGLRFQLHDVQACLLYTFEAAHYLTRCLTVVLLLCLLKKKFR